MRDFPTVTFGEFGLTANDKLRRFVFVVMRAILSVTLRLMLLMLLDLFFTGVPNFPPSKKISILRVGAERALLPKPNLPRPSRGKYVETSHVSGANR